MLEVKIIQIDEKILRLSKIQRKIDELLENGNKGKVVIFIEDSEIKGIETVVNDKF